MPSLAGLGFKPARMLLSFLTVLGVVFSLGKASQVGDVVVGGVMVTVVDDVPIWQRAPVAALPYGDVEEAAGAVLVITFSVAVPARLVPFKPCGGSCDKLLHANSISPGATIPRGFHPVPATHTG